jgi:GntR family transcriptional regulator/MocR family aminotransferase
MVDSRATFGIDLHLQPMGRRVRAGLEAALRDAVRTGRLYPGAKLPSSRMLAIDLGLARNTVVEAYGQLVAEGWLTARQGSGTRVVDRASRPEASSSPRTSSDGALRPRFNLLAGTPDLASFPRKRWLAASRRALNVAPNDAFGYSDPHGRGELRRALAEYLSRTRGVYADPDLILICAGFAQGLALLCQVLRAQGARALAVEGYSLLSHRQAAAAAGLGLRALTVDRRGAMLSQIGDADALLLTPAHQFPLGVVLAPERRAEAVRWARARAGVVIEDDYDGEFRFDRHPIGALQALAPDHVVYAGSTSKSLAPGLRLGWLLVPPRLIDGLTAAKKLADSQCSTLDQLALAEFITSGAYDHHVRRRRLVYRRRRDRLTRALTEHAPNVAVTGIAAGLHALLELPQGAQEDETVARAERHGLAIEGVQKYAFAGQKHPPSLVIGYGAPPEHAFTAAVARLCAVLGNPRALTS